MPPTALEQRVADLERKVDALTEKFLSPPIEKDWRSTIGMFTGDAVMKEIDEEGRKIRQADRKQADRDCP